MSEDTEYDSMFPTKQSASDETEYSSMFPHEAVKDDQYDSMFPEGSSPTPDQSKYGTVGQQIGTALEGAAQGATFGLSTPAELLAGKAINAISPGSGTTAEDIEGREKENPISHGLGEAAGFTGSMMSGIGEGALAAKAGKAVASKYLVNKIGMAATKGAIETALMSTGDQVSKAFVNPDFSISSAISQVGLSSILGGALGGVFGTLGKASSPILENDAKNLNEFVDGAKKSFTDRLAGVPTEAVASPKIPQEIPTTLTDKVKQTLENMKNANYYEKGTHAGEALYDHGISLLGGGAGFAAGRALGEGAGGELLGAYLGKTVSKEWAPLIIKSIFSNNITGPATNGLIEAGAGMVKAIGKGINAMDSAAANVFKAGATQALEYNMDQDKRNRVSNFVNDSTLGPNKITSIGQMGEYLPDHQTALGKTLGQVSQYLESVKPQANQLSPLDKRRDITPYQQAIYNRVLDIADQPLSICNKIKNGTVQSSDVLALKSMYPSLHGALTSKLENEMIECVARGEQIPYQAQIGMSKFTGQLYNSTLLPDSLVKIQSAFVNHPSPMQQAQAQQDNKKQKGSLKGLGNLPKLEGNDTQQRAISKWD